MTSTKRINKITCIIPAFNEQEQIGDVLNAVQQAKNKIPMDIIVIDDGSTDNTPRLLQQYRDIRVITNQSNLGKSHSVAIGLEASQTDYILLLDSDLFGMTAENIYDLFAPIQNGEAQITMSIRRNSMLFDARHDRLDLMTGERIFPRTLIAEHIDEIKALPNYGLEVFLNNLVISNQYDIKAVHWNNVLNKPKSKKQGFYSGWQANIKAAKDIFSVVSIRDLVHQYFALRKLLIK